MTEKRTYVYNLWKFLCTRAQTCLKVPQIHMIQNINVLKKRLIYMTLGTPPSFPSNSSLRFSVIKNPRVFFHNVLGRRAIACVFRRKFFLRNFNIFHASTSTKKERKKKTLNDKTINVS